MFVYHFITYKLHPMKMTTTSPAMLKVKVITEANFGQEKKKKQSY